MAFDREAIRAVVFDYGNTLIEFAERQVRACDRALADVLRKLYGSVDVKRLHSIRDSDRRAPYAGDYRENDLTTISAKLVRELYNEEPSSEQLDAILRARYDVFVDVVSAPEYLAGVLETLGGRYRLGLLSNYPDGAAIRATLAKLGLERCFRAVVVSGDVGRVKPHALPFRTVLDRLGVAPDEALYVGDNWLGDVQGAKRAGMRAVFIVQWDTPEKFDRRPGDIEPDLTIRHLAELLSVL